MGQLEKGELTTETSWREWNEVRRNSALTQTLQNLSQVNSNKGQQAIKTIPIPIMQEIL